MSGGLARAWALASFSLNRSAYELISQFLGPATNFDSIAQQEHQIFPAIDLNLSPKWEVNFGVGVGVTGSTDHLIAKLILGYRFNF